MELTKKHWTGADYKEYINYLLSQPDLKYQKFNSTLIETKYEMLGIRIPVAKLIAKEIKLGNYQEFLKLVGDIYYEELLIAGLIIADIDNLELLESYIPKIDNWGLCDYFCMNCKYMKKHPEYFEYFLNYLKSKDEYVVRVGLVMILCYFINENNMKKILNNIDKIKTDKYYINMAIAWLLCECYIKYSDISEKYLLGKNNLNDWTFNKTISKIRESYRVTKEKKEYLNGFKRKRIKV